MCTKACIEFGLVNLNQDDIQGKNVIEVGSYDVNGSIRSIICSLNPHSYVGVDIIQGPGVDEICPISDIVTHYGKESFDVVISTELMEHVQDWRNAVSNLKNILKPQGIIVLTTRSKGFIYHGYPFDFWRYEVEDMRALFSDLSIEVIEEDPLDPGVFIKAYKPENFSENDLEEYDLYSIVRDRHCRSISEFDIVLFKAKRAFLRFPLQLLLLPSVLRRMLSQILPTHVKDFIKKAF